MEERIFTWSLDGFGSTLFRITENGRERFINRYSSMETLENDTGPKHLGEMEYNSFGEFWKAFTDQPAWFRFRPVFVDKFCKPYLQDFFYDFKQEGLTLADKFRISLWLHKVEN